MTLDQLIPSEAALEEDLKDPEFRKPWESTALARWLAIEVAHYRAEHELSQRALAAQLGVHQSDVARMETGEHTPTLDRLIRVAGGLGIELMIDIHPQGQTAKLPRKRAERTSSFAAGGCEVVLATA
jgi:ribosome-binding protein aMBF1 (putative translation factor)